MRRLAFAILLCITPAARAGIMAGALTTEDGLNAVVIHGRAWTLNDLIMLRDRDPAHFDHEHGRLGHALSLGVQGLIERRDLDPPRFDHYHPLLGYLLRDCEPRAGLPEPLSPRGHAAILGLTSPDAPVTTIRLGAPVGPGLSQSGSPPVWPEFLLPAGAPPLGHTPPTGPPWPPSSHGPPPSYHTSPVPEPSGAVILGLGGLALLAARALRRRG